MTHLGNYVILTNNIQSTQAHTHTHHKVIPQTSKLTKIKPNNTKGFAKKKYVHKKNRKARKKHATSMKTHKSLPITMKNSASKFNKVQYEIVFVLSAKHIKQLKKWKLW